jgi:hypothetical protein
MSPPVSSKSILACVLLLVACKREPRCESCGMKLTPGEPFEATYETAGAVHHYDTPRCAFEAAGKGNQGKVRVQEFYDRTWELASDVALVKNSDVIGPMGKEFIPVRKDHVEKFLRDHGGVAVTAADL